MRHAGQWGSGQKQRRGIHIHDDLVEPFADHHLDASGTVAAQRLVGMGRQAQYRSSSGRRQARGGTNFMASSAQQPSYRPRSGSGYLHHAKRLAVENRHGDGSPLHEALNQGLVIQGKRALQRAFQFHLVVHQGAPEKQRGTHRPHDRGEPESAVNFADVVLLPGANQVGRRSGQIVQAQDVLGFCAVHG